MTISDVRSIFALLALGSWFLVAATGFLPRHRCDDFIKVTSGFLRADGTRLPIDRSGDFGISPLLRQLSGKQCACQ
jgi:hypothetical protein